MNDEGLVETKNNQLPQQYLQSGVVISFDDDYVDQWFEINKILQFYDWKATFFVSKFNYLSTSKIKKLVDLQSYGHEIGGHGLNHIDAQKFILENGANTYFNVEITPMLNSMKSNGLDIRSFAYPYGSRNTKIDSLLFNDFSILRGTTYGSAVPLSQSCYYNNNNNKVVYGLGLDTIYPHFSISYFLSLLEYAKVNNKIVIFYAHKPVTVVLNDYETDYRTLIEICNYVKNNNMKFYKMSDLSKI